MVVVSQYFLMREPEEALAEALSRPILLAPFPFHTSQYSLHTNMVPMGMALCNADLAPAMQGRFVPKVHPEDTGVCGMAFTDQQLIRRCRARLRHRVTHNTALAGIRCPANEIRLDEELARKLLKYSERAEAMQCQDHRGMWREEASDVHKCVLITVAHMMNFRPGQLVLDWGSGCGHSLTWAKMLFDVDGLGIDIEGNAVGWAQDHSAGIFCHVDGRNLRWIPDGIFDHVISYAALYHLTKADQCRTAVQLVEKLRVGGRAFFGWNHAPNMSNIEWIACFDEIQDIRADLARAHGAESIIDEPIRIEMEAIEDGFLFPPDANSKSGKLHFLYQFPAYSVFLTRVA